MSERKGTKALELWCKRMVKDSPEVQIDNMTTSWKNGMAFCALVHHFRPDLIDMSKLKPENIYENNQLAFSIAEKHLGIPSLLDPEDMIDQDVPDRLSILTYLSQFYQRLGHTEKTKVSEAELKTSPATTSTAESTALIKFGKAGLDKCTACSLPVYLAQRLIVSHKLYHRRCFRCTKCYGHLNPKNFDVIEGSEFYCDSCKNEKTLSKIANNNNQMGMLAFSDELLSSKPDITEESISPKRTRAQSILEKINMFESNVEKDSHMEIKLESLTLKDSRDNLDRKSTELNTQNDIVVKSTNGAQDKSLFSKDIEIDSRILDISDKKVESDNVSYKNTPEKTYKSNINKFNFLQTQLAGDIPKLDAKDDEDVVTPMKLTEDIVTNSIKDENENCNDDSNEKLVVKDTADSPVEILKKESNITDDIRIAQHSTSNISTELVNVRMEESDQKDIIDITVPPRKKKLLSPEKPAINVNKNKQIDRSETKITEYPNDLNPFSDDDDEEDQTMTGKPRVSTNPFGSSDEEDDDVPPIQSPPKPPISQNTSSARRHITACNPFWSDGEEPTSDEEGDERSSSLYNSSIATSTPNLPSSTPRHKKGKAPPPPVIHVTDAQYMDQPSTSMDDVRSISSMSSHNSTIHSDQKSFGKLTPRLKKKRIAPTPPDSLSTISGGGGSMERGVDSAGTRGGSFDAGIKRLKGPAPGLPLPERREVKLQMSQEDLQVQLDLLETQQLGLERQGVLIEQMIRDKCEGDDAGSVPQEEVEDLVIQLCELVNEKNDLFRKQTELMYIRRQQRLEQEQADIEHEIRVIQSRPAVNRIDADKAREEQLVSRLVEIVRMRDELVQQIDAERRREQQEDLAIAASIASKRAQRHSDSNSSSIKSAEVVPTPKKNKVKDKVKKQLKKAKHTLIAKKKEDSGGKEEKEKKAK